MKDQQIGQPDLLTEEHAKKSNEKMKIRKLKIEKASAFTRRLKSSLRDEEHIIEAFNNVMVDFKKNFRTGRKKINKSFVNETDRKVRVILVNYPELYIEFTKLMVSCLEKKSTLLQYEQRRIEGTSRPNRERMYRPYEKKAFIMEDARSDHDVGMEWIKSTKEKVERMIQLGHREELTAINMRCIEAMYGEYGADAVEILRAQPEKALPVIYSRLSQKLKEENDRRAIDNGLKRALEQLAKGLSFK